MAMTAKQKEANKAAQKVRDAAYRARSKAYRVAREAIERDPRIMALREKMDAANRTVETERKKVEKKRNEMLRQIEELQAAIDTLHKSPEIVAAHEKLSQSSDAWRQAKQQEEERVDADFQDLAHSDFYSCPSNWKIPPDVQRAMDDAKAEVERTWTDPA